jgi:hypothetical protein
VIVCLEEFFQSRSKSGVISADFVEKDLALVGRQLRRLMEERFLVHQNLQLGR